MTASELIAKYGSPDGNYQAKNCMLWSIQEDFPWFPVSHIFLNNIFKGMLFQSFTAVQAAALQGEITTYNGCLVVRNVRGSNSVSAHSYGCAIDLDSAIDGMVVNPTPQQRLGKWTPEFIAAMKSSGIFYGGDFIHRTDPMHWSMADM